MGAGTRESGEGAATVTEDRLRAHVAHLAGEIGERNVWRPRALAAAAEYIEANWRAQGYDVAHQWYEAAGVRSANLEVARPGRQRPETVLLVGAHYDTVRGSPGANDNASGVAALLELSRLFAALVPAVTVRFVAFVNEEPPFFMGSEQGSMVYARAARAKGDDIRLMVSLETIGFYSEAPGSQRYPPFLDWFFPETGNFLGFVSNLRSRRVLRRAAAAFRAGSDFPLEHAAVPAFVPGVDWSDHRSFWRAGYAALMATDTALYRYPHYHTRQDTPEKLTYPAFARAVRGLHGCFLMLGETGI